MSANTLLYHNPRCSKSRAALELLRARGVEPRIVAYLEETPTADELRSLTALPGMSVRALVREGEPEYTQCGLGADSSDDELIQAMTRHPRLIERPVFVHAGRAVIGRPPERVLELLDGASQTA
ncbi:MAG: arsenate reductase (glutaredoxin) [Pseudomonadota bacterium]|nr:arsenate reductase (glutaredoxin) [Pseudomonadota bacterium]